jgi:hypothetical protein
VDYSVRFLPEGLDAVFKRPLAEDHLRQIMRRMVLSNYIVESPHLANIGWCYWTPGVYDHWKEGQAQFVNHLSDVEFRPIQAAPFLPVPSPVRVTVRPEQLSVLSTLYFIEDRFVEALTGLQKMVSSPPGPKRLELYEEALRDFGDALKSFDDFDEGVNTVFALIDQIIREHMDASLARGSSMEIRSNAGEREVRKVLFSPSMKAAAATP